MSLTIAVEKLCRDPQIHKCSFTFLEAVMRFISSIRTGLHISRWLFNPAGVLVKVQGRVKAARMLYASMFLSKRTAAPKRGSLPR